jgi:hypothetical protein
MKIKNGKLRTACGRAIHIARADPVLGLDLDLIHERILALLATDSCVLGHGGVTFRYSCYWRVYDLPTHIDNSLPDLKGSPSDR